MTGMRYSVQWINVPKDGTDIVVDGRIVAVLEDRGWQFKALVEIT
jgi:hypothetical protein